MALIEQIEESLLRYDSEELPENLIAAAALVVKGNIVPHAAILTRYRGEAHLFHYTGEKVKFQPIEEVQRNGYVYILKGVNFIQPILLSSFINRCRKIVKYAKPEYGYFYDPGSHYNDAGEFVSPNEYPEFMTCVGFCINVFRYFIGEELFHNHDWDESTISGAPPQFVEPFIKRAKELIPELEYEDFKKEIRRIQPIEYLAGAYSTKRPIRKSFTDKTVPKINKVLDKMEKEKAA